MQGFGPGAFGELNAEDYDRNYPVDAATLQAVEVLAELADGGPVLELAIGTGRMALPLVERGLTVAGIEASPEMVAKLRAKPGGEAVRVIVGDMAEVAIEGEFRLVFLMFNTLFNLTRQADQVRCFANAARRLSGGGVFVLEAFVPDVAHFVDRQRVRTVRVGYGDAVLEASDHDPATQRIDYQYIRATSQGLSLKPLPMRYVWPSEMDLMAQLAGLTLRERWGGWDRSPFTGSSTKHISIYGRAEADVQSG